MEVADLHRHENHRPNGRYHDLSRGPRFFDDYRIFP